MVPTGGGRAALLTATPPAATGALLSGQPLLKAVFPHGWHP